MSLYFHIKIVGLRASHEAFPKSFS